MISTQVFFTPLSDSMGGFFPKGKRNSIWVKTRTSEDKVIKEAAIRAMDKCYGVAIKDLDLANQFEF